jgi:hypothetical protein
VLAEGWLARFLFACVRSSFLLSLANALRFGCFQFLDLLHGFVEVADGLAPFKLAALLLELSKLRVSVLIGQGVRDSAGICEDFAVAQADEVIELGDPVAHVHGLVAAPL